MTDIERAIKSCQDRKASYKKRLAYCSEDSVLKINRQIELEQVKIEALKEREERANGCEYCMTEERKCSICRWNRLCAGIRRNGKCTAKNYTFESEPFCKKCGKPMKGV